MMNNVEKDRIKLAINDRIDELSNMADHQSETDGADDEDVKLHQLTSSAVDSAVAESNLLEIRELRRNLEWLASEDGGYCEVCGHEIAGARLLAIPSARTCIDCARRQET